VSVAARLGLSVLLAGIVVVSLTVTTALAPVVVAESADVVAEARIMAPSRSVIHWLRESEFADPTLSALATPEPTDPLAFEAAPEPLREVAVEPDPTATPDPTPEPIPDHTPLLVAPPAAALASPTTLSAETRMVELMNASRARAGLLPLVVDIGVADAARAHSAAEARVRYVYHDGPDGSAHSRNVPACGTGWYGENTGKIWNDNVDVLHIEFMAEPWEPINHRTNIMDPLFRRVGVGAVIGPDAMYMTMVFCR
jgi:uncharacterized protein YkwD